MNFNVNKHPLNCIVTVVVAVIKLFCCSLNIAIFVFVLFSAPFLYIAIVFVLLVNTYLIIIIVAIFLRLITRTHGSHSRLFWDVY